MSHYIDNQAINIINITVPGKNRYLNFEVGFGLVHRSDLLMFLTSYLYLLLNWKSLQLAYEVKGYFPVSMVI